MKRRKHVPQRMCVACKQSQDKKNLVRLVRTPAGVVVDESGKMPGRGAYLHADPSCWELGMKKYLQVALRTTLTEADLEYLRSYQDSITIESKSGKGDPMGGSD